MNYVYPAVFYEEDGKISVIFPDLGNLATFGDNVADAMHMAGIPVAYICLLPYVTVNPSRLPVH